MNPLSTVRIAAVAAICTALILSTSRMSNAAEEPGATPLTFDVYIVEAGDGTPLPAELTAIADKIHDDFGTTSLRLVKQVSAPCVVGSSVRYSLAADTEEFELGPYVVPDDGGADATLKKKMADDNERLAKWMKTSSDRDDDNGARIYQFQLGGISKDHGDGMIVISDAKITAEIPALANDGAAISPLTYSGHREDVRVTPGHIVFVGRAGPEGKSLSDAEKTYIEEHPVFLIVAVHNG